MKENSFLNRCPGDEYQEEFEPCKKCGAFETDECPFDDGGLWEDAFEILLRPCLIPLDDSKDKP